MKNFIFLLIFLLSFKSDIYSQTISQQLAQINWIEARKDSFIGKPFSVLYNALSLKPKSVWGGTGHANRFMEFNHSFYFINITQNTKLFPFFNIEWTEPILKTTAQQYQSDYFRTFNTQEYPIYANKIIEKIVVVYSGD